MTIAVAVSSDFTKVAGHAGRSRRWLVFSADSGDAPPRRVELESGQVFHHHEEGVPHPLDGIAAVIAQSAGEGFLNRMKARGIHAVMTAETDPAKAVADYLADHLSAPKPRPIGALMCKAFDLFSKHK
jgi:predicted Fe-Mo cluster-binding NifX family protein